MCVAVPGKVVELGTDGRGLGTVDFQGNRAEVSLVLTPDAGVDDWVLVHAGFAIEIIEEADALATWDYLNLYGDAEAVPAAEAPRPRTAPQPTP